MLRQAQIKAVVLNRYIFESWCVIVTNCSELLIGRISLPLSVDGCLESLVLNKLDFHFIKVCRLIERDILSIVILSFVEQIPVSAHIFLLIITFELTFYRKILRIYYERSRTLRFWLSLKLRWAH